MNEEKKDELRLEKVIETLSENVQCDKCREVVAPNDRYCWNCGAPRNEQKSSCWSCKEVTDKRFAFCPFCGHGLQGIRQKNCKKCNRPFIAKLPNDEFCSKCK